MATGTYTMNEGVTPNEKSLNGAWLDFYALLGVDRGCAADALRRRIGECYAEASNNCDHRDLQRRLFYQAMVERVLPQCRRVLLNPTSRERYDIQYDLHASGSPEALPYVAFMASLMGAPIAPPTPQASSQAAPPATSSPQPRQPAATLHASRAAVSPESLASPAPIAAPEASLTEASASPVAASAGSNAQAAWEELDFSALPERVRDEIALAREVVQTLEHGFAFDLLPSRSVTSGESAKPLSPAQPLSAPSALVRPTAPVHPAPPVATSVPPAAPASPSAAQPPHHTPGVQSGVTVPTPGPDSVLEAPEAKRPFKRGAWDSDEKIPRQRPEVEHIVGVVGDNGLMQDDLVFDAAKSRAQRRAARQAPDGYTPRVVLDDRLPAHVGRDDARRRAGKGAEGIISSTARLLLTGIVAALMMLVIQRNNTAPVAADENSVSASQPNAVPPVQMQRVSGQAKATAQAKAAAQAKARLAAKLAAQKKARLVQAERERQQASTQQAASRQASTLTSSVPEIVSSVPAGR